MKTRKVLEEYLKMIMRQTADGWKKANPEIAEKIADLKQSIINCLPFNLDEFISFEELGKALKPSKIVCVTRKKFESPAGQSPCSKKCGGCSSSCSGSGECACAESDDLCDLCKNFLFSIVKLMAQLGEIDTFPYEDTFYVGR